MKRVMPAMAAAFTAACLMLTGCGSAAEHKPAAEQTQEKTAEGEESAEEAAAQSDPAQAEEASQAVSTQKPPVESTAEAEDGDQSAELQITDRPHPSDIPSENMTASAPGDEPGKADEAAKEDSAQKNEKQQDKKPSAGADSAWLDGKIGFDGMDLEFPIDLTEYKLGDWTITFEGIEDPAARTVAPDEIITAVMTSEKFTDKDVIATAEFGNYTEEPVQLSDLPMTGIYLRRGEGSEDDEGKKTDPVLPEVVLAKDITWGSSADELWAAFGEPSFSGLTNEDFDGMYENGSFYMEVAGMTDIGIDYIAYSVE